MSDQGYPGQGPEYGAQPPYGDQPYDQQRPAHGQQPPDSPQPPYGQQPAYGQQPPYGQQPDYGQTAPYGQPLYPGPEYGPPGQEYGEGWPPQYPGTSASGTGGGGRRGLLIAAIVAVVAALGVAAFLLFSGDSATAAAPEDAARALLDAGKTGDVDTAKQFLCADDNKLGLVNDLNASGHVKSYSIGKVVQQSDTRATVTVTVTTTGRSAPETTALPVVKEQGKWKVCLSRLAAPSNPSPSIPPLSNIPSISIPSISIPSISIPSISNLPASGIGNPCSYISDPRTVALAYVGAAEIGETDIAQACVYQGSVPTTVTASLSTDSSGFFAPTGSSGSTYRFANLDGSTQLAVTVTKERDGTFYITKVVKS